MAKRKFNKFMAAGIGVAAVSTAVAPTISAYGWEHPFTDINSRYDEAVSFLYSTEIVKGKSSTTFGVYDNLTRGDAAVILANALGLDTDNVADQGFKDLFPRIEGAVNALAAEGIISGVTSDSFKPNEPLSRGAMAKILVLGFGLEDYSVDTPFTDAVGVFAPYIEALYGTEITYGKTDTTYGTYLSISRGDFANLLYRTFMFSFDEYYVAYVSSAELINSKTVTLKLEETVPEEYTAQDALDSIYISMELSNGNTIMPKISSVLSDDRTELTVTFDSFDLAGKDGLLYIDDIEIPFDYKKPVAGAGIITIEGSDNPINFNFEGAATASVSIPATDGITNLNGIELVVDDEFETSETINVVLKSTDVEAAKAGEGLTWGTLTNNGTTFNLVDNEKYDIIPAGNYVLEAPFTDKANNTITLTLNITVQ
jgi:hypothetical protein